MKFDLVICAYIPAKYLFLRVSKKLRNSTSKGYFSCLDYWFSARNTKSPVNLSLRIFSILRSFYLDSKGSQNLNSSGFVFMSR